jgi:dipeptidyl aminopeptidase/acylaminoacyl peptidase
MRIAKLLLSLIALSATSAFSADRPKISLDEFFDFVSFTSVQISPDGQSVVIATERADWEKNIFRRQLWLYRDGAGGLVPLTQVGHETAPQWSPDGRWIAFLSGREAGEGHGGCDSPDEIDQLYLISPQGGEAFAVTHGGEEVHSFAWSADSTTLFFARREARSEAEKKAYSEKWKDVCQYRGAERGDTIFSIPVESAVRRQSAPPPQSSEDKDEDKDNDSQAHAIAVSPWRVSELSASPDSKRLAFATTSISERMEKFEEFEVYFLDLAGASSSQSPRQLTHNQAIEEKLRWDHDGKRLFFQIDYGAIEGSYHDFQTRLYAVDPDNGSVQRWGNDFNGQVTNYSVSRDGIVFAGRLGTQVHLYNQSTPAGKSSERQGWQGTYEKTSTATHSPRIAFVHSSIGKAVEVYLAESVEKLHDARPITSFNKLFAERDLPQGRPYKWKAEDGAEVEGMLIYPPGKFEARNLPLFVLIHGGPNDADGDHFEGDWYQWDRMAASQGWLVLEPNYRGSSKTSLRVWMPWRRTALPIPRTSPSAAIVTAAT